MDQKDNSNYSSSNKLSDKVGGMISNVKTPSNIDDSWLTKRLKKLEMKKNYQVSSTVRQDYDTFRSEAPVRNSEDDENAMSSNDSQYQNRQFFSKVRPYCFEGDLYYFEQNKHPTIQELLQISEETGIGYEQVFHRFDELRRICEVKCNSNDTCERVLSYFNPKTIYNVMELEKKITLLHREFFHYGDEGPNLCTGSVHLIVDKIQLSPDIIREYYFMWYKNVSINNRDRNAQIPRKQSIFTEVIENRSVPSNQTDFHEKAKNCKVRSLLRIIKQKPDLTVADAVVLSKLYKVDMKFIQELIQAEDVFNVKPAYNNKIRKYIIPIKKKREIVHVSNINTKNCNEKQKEEENFVNSKAIETPETTESPFDHFDGNSMVVAQYEDVVDSDEMKYADILDDKSPNRFPKDFQYFKENRHPSIQEMIEISKQIGITYRQVFYRFRDFRSAFQETCPGGCICRKVLKLFAHRAVFNGTLDAKSAGTIYELFTKFGLFGKNPSLGYFHQVAEIVDLPTFIVKDLYNDWLLEAKPSDSMKFCKDVRKEIEKEFHIDSELFYDRVSYLALKYKTSKKIVLDCHESYIEAIVEKQKVDNKNNNLTDASDINSIQGVSTSGQRKIKFNMKHVTGIPSIKEKSHSRVSSISSEQTEDEEIDIIGLDESDGKIPIDELSRTFVQSNPSIYEFPGDIDIFEENRHPSIQQMLEISQDVGVPYEEVFIRFQHLRKLKNETCSIGDTCQKVEIFNQMFPKLNGVYDEKSQKIMHEEFELFPDLGPNIPLGNIHLIMEKVELSSRIVRMQYTEWYTRIKNGKQKSEPNKFNSKISNNLQEHSAHSDTVASVSLKRKHEMIENN
uniref:HTH_48 domain-containing protein n=1 Tax=Caenorhabditis tropicalis TaxID=1561998 RepID=A0A1I7T3A1_9PELO